MLVFGCAGGGGDDEGAEERAVDGGGGRDPDGVRAEARGRELELGPEQQLG